MFINFKGRTIVVIDIFFVERDTTRDHFESINRMKFHLILHGVFLDDDYQKSIVKISLDWVLLGTPPTLGKCILEKNR